MDDSATDEQLRVDLASDGFSEVEIRPISPSLEDVFVALTAANTEHELASGNR